MLNRKIYHGFISKWVLFAQSETGLKDENDKPIIKFLQVKISWYPKKYEIVAAFYEKKTECDLEPYPFRKTKRDIDKIALLLAEGRYE